MFTLSEIRGVTLHWLLELEWAGQTLRLAERDVEAPASGGGDDVQYYEGLQWAGALPDPLSLLKDTPERKQARLIMHLKGLIDVGQAVGEGHVLGSMTGKLMLWPEGREAPVVIIDGRVRKPSRGVAEQPVVGILEEIPAQDQALWPPANAKINATTWPDHDDQVTDEYYPFVFGGPGAAVGASTFRTPGYYVETVGAVRKLLIAGHRVLASSVRVRSTNAGGAGFFSVLHEADGSGRLIAFVDIANPTSGSVTIAEGESYWVSWINSSGVQQFGLELDNTGTPLRRFVDVAVYWLSQSTVRFDRGRISAIGPKFAGWLVDTYVQASPDARITPFSWLQSQLLPLMPVSPRIGPEGLHFVPWEMDATADQALAHIRQIGDDGGNAHRADSEILSSDLDDVASEAEVVYAWDVQRDKPTARRVLTGSVQTLKDDPDARLNLFAQRGFAQYGQRGQVHVKARIVQDDSTAFRIAEWKVRRAATQRDAMAYQVDAEVAALLSPGDPVLQTDPDIGYTAKVCLVTMVEPTAQKFWFVDLEVTPGASGTAG